MNSTSASNTIAVDILPTTNTLIPQGIALAILAPLTCLIDIPPLIWHIRNRNTAAVSLVSWIIFHNLLSFINLSIWPTDDFEDHYNGEGLCDVEVKFMVARSVALPAATLCIVRSLANVLNTDKSIAIPTKAQRSRAVVMDLVWCLGLPLITMLFHYIVQPNRYFLAGVSGCTPSFWASWVSTLLMCLPPLFLSLANALYSGLVIYRVRKYGSAFKNIISSSNTTKSRFYRLLAMALILTIGLLPVEIYVLVSNLPNKQLRGGFDWSVVHDASTWQYIILYHSAVFYDRWVNVACGAIVFLLFGMGQDAKKMYGSWAQSLGLGALVPALLRKDQGGSAGGRSGTSTTARTGSTGSRAKLLFFRSKLSSSSSKGSTLVSGEDDRLDNTHNLPMSELSKDRSGRGTVSAGAWSEHGSREVLAQKGSMPDGEVMVRKEVRRGSESV